MKTEKILGVITLVGLFFKLMHLPFAGPLLVIGLGTLTLIYLIGAFCFFSDENIKKQNLPLSIISGFFLSNACMAILYKLMVWPMSEGLMSIAITTVPVILAISFWFKYKTKKTDLTAYYNNMIIRSIIITALTVVFYFI